MQLQVGVKIFIKNEQGQFLLLKRAHPYPRDKEVKWDIPGGRINSDESLIDGLNREVSEETSMELLGDPQLIYAQDIFQGSERHVVRITYIGQAVGEVLLDPSEHQEYRWVELEDVLKTYHDMYLTSVVQMLLIQKSASLKS
jgi:8-oxo-dGTP diphosphatase